MQTNIVEGINNMGNVTFVRDFYYNGVPSLHGIVSDLGRPELFAGEDAGFG